MELLKQDFFQGYTEIEQQILGLTKGFMAILLAIYVIAFDLKMRPNYESYNLSALVNCFAIAKESRLVFEETHLMSSQFANG